MNTMKKIICLVIVLALSSCMVLTAAADTEAEFVPSVTYKESIAVVAADLGGEEVKDCIVVTNIKQAEEKTTDITQEARDLLADVYEKLDKGEMKLPLEDGYVVRELVDISFMEEICVKDEDHNNKPAALAEEGETVKLTLDMGIDADLELVILVYVDEEWVEVEEVENNGDGTVTAVFEDLCPVAFAVK